MLFHIIEKSQVSSTNFRDKLQLIFLVFDLMKVPFLKCLISMYRLIAEVLKDQNLFTESHLGNWFLSYVQFYSGDHFSKRAAAAR